MIDSSEGLDLVLLIDDDELVNILNTILLRKSGMVGQVQSVNSGDKALGVLAQYEAQNRWPSLIFVDINMPGISGFGLLEKLESSGGLAWLGGSEHCVIVVLTSSCSPVDKARALSHSLVRECLEKPFTREMLSGIFARLVDKTSGPDVCSS